MLRLSTRPAIVIGGVILLVILLGCGNYGVLLHEQIIPPPTLEVALGPYEVKSGVDYDPPCGAHPYCEGGLEARTKIFYVSLFIHTPAAPGAPRILQLIRLPMAKDQQ